MGLWGFGVLGFWGLVLWGIHEFTNIISINWNFHLENQLKIIDILLITFTFSNNFHFLLYQFTKIPQKPQNSETNVKWLDDIMEIIWSIHDDFWMVLVDWSVVFTTISFTQISFSSSLVSRNIRQKLIKLILAENLNEASDVIEKCAVVWFWVSAGVDAKNMA